MCSTPTAATEDVGAGQQALLRRLDRTIWIERTSLAFVERARAECAAGDFEACHRTLAQQEAFLLSQRDGGADPVPS